MPNLFIRGLPATAAASFLLLLTACADAPAQPLATSSATPGNPPANAALAQPAQAPLSFEQWRDLLRSDAIAAGISPTLFDRAFAGVVPNPDVVKADSSQPEFSRPVWEYLNGAVSPSRIARGRILLTQNRALLNQIEQRYGVDAETLVAIWGMESNFGSNIGSHNVVRSLATLAYEGRRQAFWRSQLLAVLQILQHGDIAPESLVGSWAGAMGQTQFMPTTYNEHAVDFDGDGKRDVWTSSADALASAAHYLQGSSWQLRQPWGFEVQLPHGFDYALADPDVRRSLSEWRALGIQPVSQPLSTPRDDASATLLLPAGHRGPAFLLLGNFRSILRYNNSTSYALAIGLLSDSLRGGSGVQGAWPEGDRQLGRSERVELQERLNARGFDAGHADGIIGANTRKAIRAFQLHLGWPADGYPDSNLLDRLRQQN
ncbi:membrane-bound lytic murein transglycosylase B [Pseudomonas flavescens]|uniref:Membrane-bound lytic murein transglycosylase B n=1 Tax=Phytopseudomonas flavescens TaxID=29435 RepID=A0A1G8CW81_9GAMM|nr:lytic murein transglycosylase [Pseudomonas flavescens]SDH49712.1 membrane-bound lytic murein transglycosylase B [Pseudomonas flavescens]